MSFILPPMSKEDAEEMRRLMLLVHKTEAAAATWLYTTHPVFRVTPEAMLKRDELGVAWVISHLMDALAP